MVCDVEIVLVELVPGTLLLVCCIMIDFVSLFRFFCLGVLARCVFAGFCVVSLL